MLFHQFSGPEAIQNGKCDFLGIDITVFRIMDEVAGLSFLIKFEGKKATKEHYVPVPAD